MCLSIETPKIKMFPLVPNGKLITFKCPKLWANYSLIIIVLNTGTPKNHLFSIWETWKIKDFKCPNT